jgi:hypothetical protein
MVLAHSESPFNSFPEEDAIMQNVKVIYDFVARALEVEVLVEALENELIITTALPVLLHGSWTVTWRLKRGANVTELFFTEGIVIQTQTVPNLLTFEPLPDVVPDPVLRTLSFENDCQSAQSLKYDVVGVANGTVFQKRAGQAQVTVKFCHDPSIAVVTDPIDG